MDSPLLAIVTTHCRSEPQIAAYMALAIDSSYATSFLLRTVVTLTMMSSGCSSLGASTSSTLTWNGPL